MKYYTQIIPLDLAKKLKEKGMPISTTLDGVEFTDDGVIEIETCNNTYAEVLDWLMEKGLDITIKPYWNTDSWESYVTKIPETDMPKAGREIYVHPTWHEAANAAIEKALELIKEK